MLFCDWMDVIIINYFHLKISDHYNFNLGHAENVESHAFVACDYCMVVSLCFGVYVHLNQYSPFVICKVIVSVFKKIP